MRRWPGIERHDSSWLLVTKSWRPVHAVTAFQKPTFMPVGEAMPRQRPVAGSKAAPSYWELPFLKPPSSMRSLPVQATIGTVRGPSGDGGSRDQWNRAIWAAEGPGMLGLAVVAGRPGFWPEALSATSEAPTSAMATADAKGSA